MFCLIGQWSLGNEICWCPVTCLLSSASDWNGSFVFGSSEVQLFVFPFNISNQRNTWRFDFPKLLPRLDSCSCLGQSSLHMVSVLLVRSPRGPVRSFINVFLPLLFFYCPPSTPVLSSVAHHSHLFSTIIAVGVLHFPTTVAQLSHTESHFLSPQKFKMSELRREACAGRGKEKMQSITCPVFFPGGFVCILRARSSSKHMRICYVSFWLKLGTVGLIKDAQTLRVHITFQEAFFFCFFFNACVSLIMNSPLSENIPNALQMELSQKLQRARTQMFYSCEPSLNWKMTTSVCLIVAGCKP